jgi:aryl-alcohol dehydrogenase-like predicted oxidoreductase
MQRKCETIFWNIANVGSPQQSSVEHLRENVKAASLHLPPETVAELDAIGRNKA